MDLRRIYRKILRETTRMSRDPRPASFPYISGDGFRKLADFIHEEGSPLDATSVNDSNLDRPIILVGGQLLREYFDHVHPKILKRYILVTHNGDGNVDAAYAAKIDEKMVRWFAQNAQVAHPKITPIPIGLENLKYYERGITKIFDSLVGRDSRTTHVAKTDRKDRIAFSFNVQSNKTARRKALDALSKLSTADHIEGWPSPEKYPRILGSYKFVASPPGNGEDCHRTWEALYLGVVPIVLRSACMEYFKGLGLPIWIIDDWNELDKYDEKALAKKYSEITSKASSPAFGQPGSILDFAYWKDAILSIKNRGSDTRANDTSEFLSIIIPCYNCKKTLREAVESCYEQGLGDGSDGDPAEFEIVMVDDASTDGTRGLMEQLAGEHKNIRVLSHPANRGGGAARNTGIKEANGPLIYCLDSDNFFGPGQPLKKMRDFLYSNALDGASFYERRFFIGNDSKHYQPYFNKISGKDMTLGDLFLQDDAALLDNFLYTKDSYLKTAGYPENHGFDTQSFEVRWISAGNRARVCPGTVFYHRTAVGKGSYFEREYDKGNFSKNYYLIIEDVFGMLSDKAKEAILDFDIFARSSMKDNLMLEMKKLHAARELFKGLGDMSIGSIIKKSPAISHYESSLKSYNIGSYEEALREARSAIEAGLRTKIAMYQEKRCELAIEGVPRNEIDERASSQDPRFSTSRQKLYKRYHKIPILNRLASSIISWTKRNSKK